MDEAELRTRLHAATANGDAARSDLDDIGRELRQSAAGAWAIDAILQFMEREPDADFGAPGGLVHFIEAFPLEVYLPRLKASLERRPTPHTLWMLNRSINAASSNSERSELLALMQACEDHPFSRAEEREEVDNYLRHHSVRR
jgi:hypothetical protein